MTDYSVKIFNESLLDQSYISYVIGIDIGGTQTNIAIAGVENRKPVLLFSLNFDTQSLSSIESAINESLRYAHEKYGIEVTCGCIGAAGVVSSGNDNAILTNIPWNVNKNEIIEKTALTDMHIVNDFQIIGYGLNLIDVANENDIYIIRKGKSIEGVKPVKAIIGAGTGLGKSILVYDNQFEAYIPIPSEGGHGDFPIYDEKEQKLISFIKERIGISQPVTYEEVLSGRGLENIYYFMRETKKFEENECSKSIDESTQKASLISTYKDTDDFCKEAFEMYVQFYARCAKNFVLDSLALGGLYIAGGIAAKNPDMFAISSFIESFENAYRRDDVLQNIPIYVVVNYDISLLGACYSALYFSEKTRKLIL